MFLEGNIDHFASYIDESPHVNWSTITPCIVEVQRTLASENTQSMIVFGDDAASQTSHHTRRKFHTGDREVWRMTGERLVGFLIDNLLGRKCRYAIRQGQRRPATNRARIQHVPAYIPLRIHREQARGFRMR